MIKEDLKNLLSSFTKEDYYKNVDLHIHSDFSDGKMTPARIAQLAKEQNKKYVAIADHNTIDAYINTNVLSNKEVIPAVEFDCLYKNNIIHILGYGINIDNAELKTLCSQNILGRKFNLYRIFRLRNPKDVIEKINKAGGIAVLAHPACYFTSDFDAFVKDLVDMGLEGLEVYYLYRFLRKLLNFRSIAEIETFADKYNLIKTGGTDTHGYKLLG